jgi:hypothetical protein
MDVETHRRTETNPMNTSALVLACLFLLGGLRFVVTFRHNNDLYFIGKRNTIPEPSNKVPGLNQEPEGLDGEPKYSSPALALTIGVACLLFGCIVLIMPNGVGLWGILHL